MAPEICDPQVIRTIVDVIVWIALGCVLLELFTELGQSARFCRATGALLIVAAVEMYLVHCDAKGFYALCLSLAGLVSFFKPEIFPRE